MTTAFVLRRVWPVLVFHFLCSCTRREDAPVGSQSTTAAQGMAQRATVNASPSTATPLVASDSVLVDLVHHTASLIVSSSHKDARSRVQFVVDELSASAWRPNPPDPSPWLELRFAHAAEIHSASIDLEPGTALPPELELRSPELGTATREDNTFVFHLPEPVSARSVRIDIPSRTQGKRGSIAFSELRVRGKVASEHVLDYALPEGRAQRNGPYFRINSPKFRSFYRGAPYSSADELCVAYEKAMAFAPVQDIPNGRKFAYCSIPDEPLAVEGDPPQGVRSVRSGWVVITPAEVYDGESATLLFVETDTGWYPANVWSDNDSFEGMCPGMHVARAHVERTFWDGAVLSQQRSRMYFPPSGLYDYDAHRVPAAARSLIRCDTAEPLTCREHVLAYGEPKVDVDEDTFISTPVTPEVWAWERTFTTAENGWLRLSPCRGTATGTADRDTTQPTIVPCLAPDEPNLP